MNILKFFKISFLFSLFLMMSCEDNVDFYISEAEKQFTLNQPSVSNIYLNFNYPENPAFTITWNDDITGATSYVVQMSQTLDFANPVVLGNVSKKQFTINVEDLNQILNSQGITAYSNTTVLIRIVGNSNTSNAVAFNINSFPTGKPVILSPPTNTSVVLSSSTPDATALAVTWKDDSISEFTTVDVMYTVQLAIGTDTNFANPRLLSETSNLNADITHETINQAALTIGVAPQTPTQMKIRVKAVMQSTSGDVVRYSDPITITLTAYPNFPELYLVGDATAAGWNPNNHNHPLFRDPNQSGHYIYVGYFNAGMFKMLEVKGQWQPQWGKGASNGTLAGNPATQTNDPDVITVPTGGYYTFDVNLTNLSYTLTPYDASAAPTYHDIGLIGHATPTGWGSDTNLTQSSFNPHIWYAEGFVLNQDPGGDCDCGFKFRANDSWDFDWGGNQNPPTLNYGVAIFGGKNIGVPETGNYTVFFNDIDGRYWYVLD